MRDYSSVVLTGRPILASEIQTLRDYIDEDLESADLSFDWSWSSVNSNTPIQSRHLTEIRDAIQVLWDDRDAGELPAWQDATALQVQSGSSNLPDRVIAPNVTQARTWLNQTELNSVPVPIQGLDTLTYRPSDPNSPEASTDWVNDARSFSPKISIVRTIITARELSGGHREVLSSNTDDIDSYMRSFARFSSGGRNLPIFAVLNAETYWQGQNVNEALPDPVPPSDFPPADATNPYIESFAAGAKRLMDKFGENNRVKDFIIWNEPNNHATLKRLESYTFGAMMHRVWQVCVKGRPNPPRLYTAGIESVIADPGHAAYYLDPAIKYVRYRMDQAGEPGWPWVGLNFHVHQNRETAPFNELFRTIDNLRTGNDQSGELLVGEWGVGVSAPTGLSGLYSKLVGVQKSKPTKMFYFSHQRFFEPAEWGCRIALPQENTSSGKYEYQLGNQTALYQPLKSALG